MPEACIGAPALKLDIAGEAANMVRGGQSIKSEA
jgi:hypothetical protein